MRRIEDARTRLKAHYLDNYLPGLPSVSDTANPQLSSTPLHGTPARFDFFASYAPLDDVSPTIELDELFKLRPLGFGKQTPLPLVWWRDHQIMYPNVSRLARDILTIPGECIFCCMKSIFSFSLHRVCCCCRACFFRRSRYHLPPTS